MARINRKNKKNGPRTKTKPGYKMVAYCPLEVGKNPGQPQNDPHVTISERTRSAVCPNGHRFTVA